MSLIVVAHLNEQLAKACRERDALRERAERAEAALREMIAVIDGPSGASVVGMRRWTEAVAAARVVLGTEEP